MTNAFAVVLVLSLTPAPYLPPQEALGYSYCLNPDAPVVARSRSVDWSEETRVKRSELVKDIDFLFEVLRTTYPGFAEFAQHPSFNIGVFFEKWKRRLETMPHNITLADAIGPELTTLHRLVPDNHHVVVGLHRLVRQGPCTAAMEYFSNALDEPVSNVDACALNVSPSPSCPTPTWRRDTLRMASRLNIENRIVETILATTVIGGPEQLELQCGQKKYRLSRRPPIRALHVADDALLYESKSVADTLVITIRRFSGTEAQLRQLEQLATDFPAHAQYSRLVFDLRNNSGGNDRYVYDWIARANAGTWDSGASTVFQGQLGPCWSWNRAVLKGRDGMNVSAGEWPAHLARLRAQWTTHKGPLFQYQSGLVSNTSSTPYKGKIYVLVNRNSGSSGESAAWALKQALGATLVGERTAGVMEFGDVVQYVLPRTGVRWQLATKRNHYTRSMETVGLPVDVYLDDVTADAAAVVSALDASR